MINGNPRKRLSKMRLDSLYCHNTKAVRWVHSNRTILSRAVWMIYREYLCKLCWTLCLNKSFTESIWNQWSERPLEISLKYSNWSPRFLSLFITIVQRYHAPHARFLRQRDKWLVKTGTACIWCKPRAVLHPLASNLRLQCLLHYDTQAIKPALQECVRIDVQTIKDCKWFLMLRQSVEALQDQHKCTNSYKWRINQILDALVRWFLEIRLHIWTDSRLHGS